MSRTNLKLLIEHRVGGSDIDFDCSKLSGWNNQMFVGMNAKSFANRRFC